jgi:aromatic ring-opening dioxygenase LigB subunit
MSNIVFSGLSPHPPILVPEIGGNEIEKCMKSRQGLQAFSKKLVEANPELLILITPHGPTFYDALSVYTLPSYFGNFRQFGAPHVKIEAKGAPETGIQIIKKAKEKKIPVLELNEAAFKKYSIPSSLDHATMVPLYYFQEAGLNIPMVLISIGFLPYPELFEFGKCIPEALAEEKKRIAVVASGDLSHRLIPTAPAGYDPIGKEFDRTMIELLKAQDAQSILKLDADLIERAGECGFRPILIMLGAIQNLKLQSEVISYEGPFGVGYGVVVYTPSAS